MLVHQHELFNLCFNNSEIYTFIWYSPKGKFKKFIKPKKRNIQNAGDDKKK